MPRDDDPEFDEYGQIVNPDKDFDENVKLEDVLEDVEEMSLEEDPTIGEITVHTNSWETRINQYKTAAEALGIRPDHIYEPANGGDISTAEAFPEAQITYAEVMEEAVEAINEEFDDTERVNSVLEDGEEYQLDDVPDLVVLRNAAMDETEALKNNPAEYVIANNYLGNASGVEQMEDYELKGIIHQIEDTEFHLASQISDGDTPDDAYVFQKVE